MATPPKSPKIYHITHIGNLANVITDDCIWSDQEMISRGLTNTNIGMSKIKRRRLDEIEVYCHADTNVGEYAAFYFCPRSVMLYLIHMGNHEELTYFGGQEPVAHLRADFYRVVKWAEKTGVDWAFTTGNAGAYAAVFFDDLDDLDEVDWQAVGGTDFSTPDLKEGKQAEFLIKDFLPWGLIEAIGVYDDRHKAKVESILTSASHRPKVRVAPRWYY